MEYYESTSELYNAEDEAVSWSTLNMKVYLASCMSYLIIFTIFSIINAKGKTAATKWIAVVSLVFAFGEAEYKLDPWYDSQISLYIPNTQCRFQKVSQCSSVG